MDPHRRSKINASTSKHTEAGGSTFEQVTSRLLEDIQRRKERREQA
jgi:hypothetical protein